MEYVKAKTIITRSKNPSGWFGAQYNMNIYRGCTHGCIYCDSRSDCYNIDNFDTVRAKENALEIIRNELSHKIKKDVIATGSMSDPYNPLEKEHKLTRHALELISAYGFGVSIATKSTLVERDIDILGEVSQNAAVIVKMTITAANDDLAKIIEPQAPPSSQRFKAINKLSSQGIFAGILLMPTLPFLLDSQENISAIVDCAYDNGAKFIYPAFGMTLRGNQREYFYNKLDLYFPGYKEKYIKAYANSYACHSKNAKSLWSTFTKICDKRGILYNMPNIISAYKTSKQPTQLNLFNDL